jgi:hypothetical protein
VGEVAVMASVRQIVLDEIVCDWRGKWLVLRCANKNTLALVAALTRVGLRAWTPMLVRRRRYPRSRNTRPMALPCLPSFVFLAEADAVRALDAKERSGAPSFSLMKSYGVLVRIKDADLASLRAEVADLNPRKENAIVWPAIGSEQKIISGAFQGLVGKVIGRTQHHCLVDIGNKKFPSVKIPPFLLADLDA